MSAGSRIIIAAISLVCAAGFFMTAFDPSGLMADPQTFYGLAVLCVVIAIASLSPQSHPFTLRMIGTMIFCGHMAHVGDSINDGNLGQALLGLVICGLPAGFLAIKGKSLTWGEFSQVFH